MSSEELRRWAKTTEFPTPIRWGEIETRIQSEPGPTPEESAEWEAFFPHRSPALRVAVGSLRALVLAPVVLPTAGAPVLGLGFVLAYVAFDTALPDDFGIVLQLMFGAAVIVSAFPVYMWWESRRRGWENLGLSALTALSSAGSFLLLATTTQPVDGVWSSVSWMALAAAVIASVAFVFFLLVAKPPPRLSLRERLRHVSHDEKWEQGKRAVVMEELRKRQLVNDADSAAIIQLPPDTWSQLESLPDGRVVRHL